ncbi:MAG: hypothetical protein JWL82_444 [Parcubacteria group bacterium]|nr:hypothetical protein [Parcubacteria group bacterium]
MKKLLLAATACVVVLGIGVFLYFRTVSSIVPTASEPVATVTTSKTKVIAFKVLDSGDVAKGMPERKNYAIYNATEFRNFWLKAHGTDGAPVPSVDFSKQYVIGVFAGSEPTGGYSISVSRITDSGTEQAVAIVIQEPGANCSQIEEETRPYQFVSVPLSEDEALSHTDERTKHQCK